MRSARGRRMQEPARSFLTRGMVHSIARKSKHSSFERCFATHPLDITISPVHAFCNTEQTAPQSAPPAKTRHIFGDPGDWLVLLASPGGAGRWSAPTTHPMVVTSTAARGGGAVCAAARVFESPDALYISAQFSAHFGGKWGPVLNPGPTLLLNPGPQPWSSTLVLYPGPQPWSSTPVLNPGPQPCSSTQVRKQG